MHGFFLAGEKNGASGNPVNLENATAMAAYKIPFEDTKKRTTQVGLVAVIVILLAAVLFTVVTSVVVSVFCYSKRLKDKFPDNSETQKEIVRLQERDDIMLALSTPIPSEPNTSNQTDRTLRPLNSLVPRRRLSFSGSFNAITPLLKYKNGSYSSRFSSGASSGIDSNIAEGKELTYSFKNLLTTTSSKTLKNMVETPATMFKSSKKKTFFLIFHTCFDGTSVIVNVTMLTLHYVTEYYVTWIQSYKGAKMHVYQTKMTVSQGAYKESVKLMCLTC